MITAHHATTRSPLSAHLHPSFAQEKRNLLMAEIDKQNILNALDYTQFTSTLSHDLRGSCESVKSWQLADKTAQSQVSLGSVGIYANKLKIPGFGARYFGSFYASKSSKISGYFLDFATQKSLEISQLQNQVSSACLRINIIRFHLAIAETSPDPNA